MEVREEILFYAFRYALGRMTYAVGDVSDCLIENWDRLSKNMKMHIIDEIKEAVRKGEAGMDMDKTRWNAVLLLEEAVKEEKA